VSALEMFFVVLYCTSTPVDLWKLCCYWRQVYWYGNSSYSSAAQLLKNLMMNLRKTYRKVWLTKGWALSLLKKSYKYLMKT